MKITLKGIKDESFNPMTISAKEVFIEWETDTVVDVKVGDKPFSSLFLDDPNSTIEILEAPDEEEDDTKD